MKNLLVISLCLASTLSFAANEKRNLKVLLNNPGAKISNISSFSYLTDIKVVADLFVMNLNDKDHKVELKTDMKCKPKTNLLVAGNGSRSNEVCRFSIISKTEEGNNVYESATMINFNVVRDLDASGKETSLKLDTKSVKVDFAG